MTIGLRSHKVRVVQLIRFIILTISTILWLVPILWIVITSVKPENQILELPPRWFPNQLSDFTVAHYFYVLFEPRRLSIGRAFLNTTILCAIIPTLTVIICTCAAYAFARLQFPGQNVLFAILVLAMILPGQIILLPNFVTCWRFGWLDTYHAIIWPALAGPASVFMMRQFMLGIPIELEEAARIDGCNRLGIFLRVDLPLVKGAILTQFFFSFLGTWNSFMWPLIVLNDLQKMTLPVALALLQGTYWSEYGKLMACAVVSAVPPSLLFVFGQKLIIQSITLTGLKG